MSAGKSALLSAKMAGIYADRFMQVNPDGIVLVDYYAPIGDKFIPWKEIQGITFLPAGALAFYEKKAWGMAWTSVWWGCDFSRQFTDSRILMIIDVVGGVIRKGSSVENLAGVLAALARYAPTVRPMLHASLIAVPPAAFVRVPVLAPPVVTSK